MPLLITSAITGIAGFFGGRKSVQKQDSLSTNAIVLGIGAIVLLKFLD